MVNVKIGIIGGTGLDNPDIIEKRKESIISTPFGSVEVVQGTIQSVPCVSKTEAVDAVSTYFCSISGSSCSSWEIAFSFTFKR